MKREIGWWLTQLLVPLIVIAFLLVMEILHLIGVYPIAY